MPSRRRFVAGAGCLAAGAAGVQSVASAGLDPSPTDWPVPRHDAAGTGHNPAGSGPTDDVTVRWERPADGSLFGSDPPILVGGTLFTAGPNSFVAFDAETGEKRFERSGSFSSAPAWVGSDVYRTDTLAMGERAGVFGVNAGGGYELAGRPIGFERWHAPRTDSDDDFHSPYSAPSPVAADGTVYAVVPAQGSVVAVHGDSGRVEWRYSFETDLGSTPMQPAVLDGVAYLASWPHELHAVDADSGEALWTTELDVRVTLAPTATSDGIVVPSREAVTVVDPADGRTLWTYGHGGNATEGSAAVTDETIFVTDDERLHAIDIEEGEARWTVEYSRQVSPTVADGVVYLSNHGVAEVTAFDAESGDRLWTRDVPVGASQPVVGDGTLYVAGYERIVALEEA